MNFCIGRVALPGYVLDITGQRCWECEHGGWGSGWEFRTRYKECATITTVNYGRYELKQIEYCRFYCLIIAYELKYPPVCDCLATSWEHAWKVSSCSLIVFESQNPSQSQMRPVCMCA